MQLVFYFPRLKKLTGAERLILKLADYASREGAQVTLLTHRLADECRPDLAPGVRLIETGRRMEWTGQHYADAALEYLIGPWILRKLPELEENAGFCFFGAPGLPALWWTKRVLLRVRGRRDAPCLYFCYEPPRVIYSDTAAISSRLGPAGFVLRIVAAVYKRIDKRMVGAADGVLSNSRYGSMLVRKAYNRRAEVIEHGVDFAAPDRAQAAQIRAGFDLGARTIAITVNHLHPRKRIDMFINALAKAGDNVAGVIVGKGPERERLVALAESLGVADRVRFAGFVADKQLPAYYAAADLYAHTGLQESFGLSVIEAEAMGLPVVAVNEGGPTSTVRDHRTGLLVESNAAAVAAGMRELAQNPELRRRMGREAASYVRGKFSWSAGAKTLLKEVASSRAKLSGKRK